jgi:hypothetical protein
VETVRVTIALAITVQTVKETTALATTQMSVLLLTTFVVTTAVLAVALGLITQTMQLDMLMLRVTMDHITAARLATLLTLKFYSQLVT